MMISKFTILEQASNAFKGARANLLEGARLLNQIKAERLWQDRYESFSEFLETCQISDSFASKLIQVYQHYVIEGGFSHAKIGTIDPERLYLAISLPKTTEERYETAKTLSRSELRDEVRESIKGVCEHPLESIITLNVCTLCHHRV